MNLHKTEKFNSRLKTYNYIDMEPYRELGRRIQFVAPNVKVLAIMSGKKTDGSAEISINFAKYLASIGKRVLLIDGNLRLKEVSLLLNISNGVGLDTLLQNPKLNDNGISTLQNEKIDVMPVMETTDFSTEILERGDLGNIIKSLKTEYDYIIIDTLPLEKGMDAYIIAKKCDGSLFIAVKSDSKKKDLKKYQQMFTEGKINLIGSILA